MKIKEINFFFWFRKSYKDPHFSSHITKRFNRGLLKLQLSNSRHNGVHHVTRSVLCGSNERHQDQRGFYLKNGFHFRIFVAEFHFQEFRTYIGQRKALKSPEIQELNDDSTN